MKTSYLTATLIASGLLMAAPAFAQSTLTPTPAQKATPAVHKQHTDGEDVTGNNNFRSATTHATKQHTDGEDVTGNNNFPAASK
jgi:hypothetical protein